MTVLGEGEEDADPVHEPLPNCADVPAAHRPTGPPPLRGACNHLVRAFFGGSCEGKVHLRRRKGWRFRRVRGGICTCTLRCSRPARWSWSVPAPTPTAFSSGLANNGRLGARCTSSSTIRRTESSSALASKACGHEPRVWCVIDWHQKARVCIYRADSRGVPTPSTGPFVAPRPLGVASPNEGGRGGSPPA